MKVKELIKILEQQDQELDVIIDYAYESGDHGWSSTEYEERDVAMTYNYWGDEFHISAYNQGSELEQYEGIKIFK